MTIQLDRLDYDHIVEDVRLGDLKPKRQALLQKAVEARALSYSPYSGFPVGSAALADAGAIVGGANVEDAAFGSSMCSERSALLRANAQAIGGKIVAIAIITEDASAPCGSCRQSIWTSACRSGIRENFEILLATPDLKRIKRTTIGRLLPLPFGAEDLAVSEKDSPPV